MTITRTTAKRRYNLELDNNNHSVFNLNYHLIICVKYRRRVINDLIAVEIFEMFSRIGKSYHVTLSEGNHDVDHIHILMKAHPNSDLSRFIGAFKSASSRLIKKDHPEIRSKLWKEAFWSTSYCLLTVGGAPLSILKAYIESQGEHQ